MSSITHRGRSRKGHEGPDREQCAQPTPELSARLRRHTPKLAASYADQVAAATQAQGRERDVLYFLAVHAEEDEEVEMGQRTLSLMFDLSPKTIGRILGRLRRLGELRIVRRARWRHPNRYRISVPRDV